MTPRSKIWLLSILISVGLWSLAIRGGALIADSLSPNSIDTFYTASTK